MHSTPSLYFVLHYLECKIQRHREKLRSSSSPCKCFYAHFYLDCSYYLCVLEHPENLGGLPEHLGDPLMAQSVQSLPAMQETWTWEDPLEKEMATHSSILAWRIPWTEEPGGPQSMGSQRVGHGWVTSTFTFMLFEVLITSPLELAPRLAPD